MEQQPRKKYDPVVRDEVGVSKKNTLKKSFIAKDAKEVGHYAFFDVLIPSIKRIIYDLTIKSLGMSLFGTETSSNSGYTSYARPYQSVSYGGNYPMRQLNAQQQPQKAAIPGVNDYQNFVFKSRGDAELVLNQMTDIIEEYGMVRVSELYDLVGKTAPVTSENYGWKSVVQARVDMCSEGFCIKLPPCYPL